MENYDWKIFGKIAASICLSALIGFFWISNAKKPLKIDKNPALSSKINSAFQKPFSKSNLIVFWASWCQNCKEDLIAIKELIKEMPESLQVYAVNLDSAENLALARNLWQQAGLQIELVYDSQGFYQNELSIDVLPTYFLFDQEGNSLLRFEGAVNWTDSKVKTLLLEELK